jgi:uncharacterized protein with PIN domain
MHLFFDNTWVFGECENCRRNSKERVKMVRQIVEYRGNKEEMWVCPVCGATKKL